MSEGRVVHCRVEEYDVYIGRPSRWGNPFSEKLGTLASFRVPTRIDAIEKYKEWLMTQPELIERAKRELRGKVLGCWCHPKTCHGDILVELANQED